MNQIIVASFTDAWIETLITVAATPLPQSHLLQMRGLKLQGRNGKTYTGRVASFTDAWIETTSGFALRFGIASHLLQMRGLKLLI